MNNTSPEPGFVLYEKSTFMKKSVLLVFLLLTNLMLLHAQKRAVDFSNSKIGITYTPFGSSDVFRVNELAGAASYEGEHFYTFGITYMYGLTRWLEVETAFEFSKYNILIRPNLPPGTANSPWKGKVSLVNIPVTLKVNFLRYCFVNGGLFADIDVSDDSPVDNQSGLGTVFGMGLKYDFDFGVSVFANPYTKVHSLISLADRDSHQRIWENGLRLGATYNLGK
jgi:hypothetical protein